MSKSRALVFVLFAAVAVSSQSYGDTADRVVGDLTASPKVALQGNVHGLARPEFDLGRADGSRVIQGLALSFRPSPAQQQDLNNFLAQLADPHSKNFHKYLTPAQFGARFGMSQNDMAKISAWLEGQGFTNLSVANGRNMISFDGTISQVESVFALEMHNYLIDGVVHTANSGEPSVPAPLAGMVLFIHHLQDFPPKPRVKVKSNLTSYVSGDHYLTPGDFAVIYDLGTLYTAGGTGQKIAVIGQSTVSTADLNNFRSAAGLAASTVTMTLAGGTATRCPGDEGESDLDLEWSGGVAQNASVTFVYAGLGSGDTCSSRSFDVWNALQYAVDHNVAPFVSTSYGYCESPTQGITLNQALTFQGWIQEGQAQGQTLTAASGDSGAADCDSGNSATLGLAVDVPSSIPETTGAGGDEFTADSSQCPSTGCTTNTAPADSPYWAASNAGSDAIVSALEFIPEEAWNDTALSLEENPPGGLSASGGGASQYFQKPTWQTGTAVPKDGQRDVPDISVSTSQFHDPYLICSEDSGTSTPQQSCTVGFRTGAGGPFTAVGGTSAAAPTFTAILALINQFVGNPGTTGLAPINPTLYSVAASTPLAFHDVTTGNNMVPCTTGTVDCPAGTTQIGYNAGVGYDQVTGWGSPDVTQLANAWEATLAQFTVTAGSVTPASVPAGSSATVTITVAATSAATATGETVTFSPSSCSGLTSGAQCTSFSPASVVVPASGSVTTTLTIQTTANMAAGTSQFTVKGTSTGTSGTTTSASASVSLAVSATAMSFTLSTNLSGGTLTVAQGQTTSPINISVGSTSTPSFLIANGSSNSTALPLTYSCSGVPGNTCIFTPGATTSSTTVTLTIPTTAPTSRLQPPFGRANRIFYAVLLPGLLGIVLTVTSRKKSMGAARMLALIFALGLSTLWMASCSGTNGGGNKITGTPTGNYSIIVSASTGGPAPITNSVKFTLNVTP
jgi:hypothetical protein